MEDALEKSLDRLDARYESISKILEIPLFYDSPQIRQVINDIKECQTSILFVANEIGQLEEIQEDDEENR
jgi:UDP-N-acetyl-D-mannosaminuronic acid transferase (WecB/TagA/CpsF family)